jgi:diguanylate cyclase (GGDEF)-like protein
MGWVGETMRQTTAEHAVYVFRGEATPAHDLVVSHRGPGRERLLGGASEETRIDWAEAVHPEDRPMHRTAESYAQLRKGKPIDVEFRLLGVDGRERWMHEYLVPRWAGGRLHVDGVVIDVTSQRLSRIGAEQAQRRLEKVMRRADTYVWVAEAGADGVVRDVYSVAGIERMVGGSLADLAADEDPQGVWRNAVHPDDRAAFDGVFAAASRGESFDLEYRIVGHDGVTRIVRDQGSVTMLGGLRYRIEGLVQEVTAEHDQRRALASALAIAEERADEVSELLAETSTLYAFAESAKQAAEDHARRLVEAQAELERIGRLDSLTGLTNRRHATELMETTVAEGRSIGIAMLDVDRFKRVNDTYGHAGGDQVLIEVARRLEAVRGEDLVSRWGGEEFSVLLTDITDEASLHAAAERLRAAIASSPVTLAEGTRLEMTVSVGVTRSTRPGEDLDRLIAAADAALYRAKRGGRNQVQSAARPTAEAGVMPRRTDEAERSAKKSSRA